MYPIMLIVLLLRVSTLLRVGKLCSSSLYSFCSTQCLACTSRSRTQIYFYAEFLSVHYAINDRLCQRIELCSYSLRLPWLWEENLHAGGSAISEMAV